MMIFRLGGKYWRCKEKDGVGMYFGCREVGMDVGSVEKRVLRMDRSVRSFYGRDDYVIWRVGYFIKKMKFF